MKKYLLLFSLFIITLSSCQKGVTVADQAAIDDAKIQAYIKANKLTLTKDPSGFYYQILLPGAAAPAHPVSTSTVQVSTVNTFLNGAALSASTVTNIKLSNGVPAFQTAMTKIGTGGRIYFIAPSALAYGLTTTSAVPANAVVIFTVDLIGYY